MLWIAVQEEGGAEWTVEGLEVDGASWTVRRAEELSGLVVVAWSSWHVAIDLHGSDQKCT